MKKDLRGINKVLNSNHKITIKIGNENVRVMTVEKLDVEFTHEKFTGANLNDLLINASKDLLKDHKEMVVTDEGDKYPHNFLDNMLLSGATIKLLGDEEKGVIAIGIKTIHSSKMEYVKTIEKGTNVLTLLKNAEVWAEAKNKKMLEKIYDNKRTELFEL